MGSMARISMNLKLALNHEVSHFLSEQVSVQLEHKLTFVRKFGSLLVEGRWSQLPGYIANWSSSPQLKTVCDHINEQKLRVMICHPSPHFDTKCMSKNAK